MTQDGGLRLTYDASGRLSEAKEAGSLRGRYFYNGQGQRAVKDECRVYVYDLSGNLVGEYKPDGTMVAETVYADGMRVAEYRDVNAPSLCTPAQPPAQGYSLSKNPDFPTEDRSYYSANTLYTLVWSDQVDEGQVTQSTAQLAGAKGVKATYSLVWDPEMWGWKGSYALSGLNLTRGGNNWTWTATITDALGGSYLPVDAITVTVGGGAMALAEESYSVTPLGKPAPTPTVTSVSPNTGSTAGQTAVSVYGTNFTSGAAVTFGGTAATGVVFVSSTRINCVTPAHAAGAVDVRVTNPSGKFGTLAAGYTYTAPSPPPTVVSVTPNSGDISGGDTVTVSGGNFVSGASVSFGGVNSPSVTFVDASTLNAVTPAHNEGAVTVAVTNPDSGTGSLSNGFTYIDLSAIPNVRLSFFHGDHLGTPLFLTDASGTVVWKADYLPFGDILTQTTDPDGDGVQVSQPFRFPGQYEDQETGLYYNYFRDYEPRIGRYAEPDPIGQWGEINTFNYTNGSPIGFVDPFGLKLSKADCAKFRYEIHGKAKKLIKELRKYNPMLDGLGGFPTIFGKPTLPGGHWLKIKELQQGLKGDLTQYVKDCMGDNDDDCGGSGYPKEVDELANRDVPFPVIPWPHPKFPSNEFCPENPIGPPTTAWGMLLPVIVLLPILAL